MIVRRTVLALVVVALYLAPPAARSDDLSALQATFEKDIRLFNAGNLDAFTSSAHDEVVLFGILSPFSIEGKDAVRQLIQEYLADHKSTHFTLVNPEFDIAGTTALAWGHFTLTELPQVGPKETFHGRYTFSYTKAGEQWLLVALHFSPLTF